MTPPRDTPGPSDQTGGDFVLQEATAVPSAPTLSENEKHLDLADGSDVHDVDGLGRQLADQTIETMLREYLDDERDVPSLPPAPQHPRRP